MKFLLVDDTPDIKLIFIIKELSKRNIDFIIAKSYMEAMEILYKEHTQIAGAVVDLGLPLYSDGSTSYNSKQGLDIINIINNKYKNISVLINSSTELKKNEKESIKVFAQINCCDINVIKTFIDHAYKI